MPSNLSFPDSLVLESSLLLVEVTPYDILIGVTMPHQNLMTYDSINPILFNSLEDLVLTYLDRLSLKERVRSAFVSLPLSFLQNNASHAFANSGNLWTFDVETFKNKVGLSEAIFVDRATSISYAIPFLQPNDVITFSSHHDEFQAVQSPYMVSLIDQSYESVFTTLNGSHEWESTKSFEKDLGLESQDPDVQNILAIMTQKMSFPEPNINFFFSTVGLESLYGTLYQEKGMEMFLKSKFETRPRIVDPGAPNDIDPQELNSPPKVFLEGVTVNISSVDPSMPTPIPYAKSYLPLTSKKQTLSQNTSLEINWNLLRALTFPIIVKESLSYKGILGPQTSSLSSQLPQDIQKFCFECLTLWSKILGETLGRHVLVMSAAGGVYLSGRLLLLIKTLLGDLSLAHAFEKEMLRHVFTTQPSLYVIIHPLPAFIGMVYMTQKKITF